MLFVHRTVLSCVKNNNKDIVPLWHPIVLYKAENIIFSNSSETIISLMGKDGSKEFGFINLFLISKQDK